MINRERLFYLFDRYIQNTGTTVEKQELFRLLADPSYEEQLREISESYHALPAGNMVLDDDTTESVWEAIRKGIPVQDTPVRRMRFTRMWWAAAAILIILSGAALWYWQPADNLQSVTAGKVITPGVSGAVLTLADGQTIVLDSLQNGLIASQHGTNVLLANGQVTYSPVNNNIHPQPINSDVTYNMLTIPRGRKFRLLLPDGTRVWLNAASSIRYPTAFSGSNRTVEVTGEAYFDVVHNAAKPFIVNINPTSGEKDRQGTIEVLGTRFNVNAYSDEPGLTTTLLEGLVKFTPDAGTHTEKGVVLLPGEEAVLQNGTTKVNSVDTEPAVAWINDMFSFRSADLQMVLRQLERWYDVEIECDESIKARFSGSIYRSEDFYELLKIIEFTSNVQFIINQKTIKVLPKQ